MAVFVSSCWSTYPWSWFPSSSLSSGRPPRPSTPQHFHPSSGSRFIFKFNSTIISVHCSSSDARLISAASGWVSWVSGFRFCRPQPPSWSGAFHRDCRATGLCKTLPVGRPQNCYCQGWVRQDEEGWDYLTLDLRFGFSPPYGPKAWWELATTDDSTLWPLLFPTFKILPRGLVVSLFFPRLTWWKGIIRSWCTRWTFPRLPLWLPSASGSLLWCPLASGMLETLSSSSWTGWGPTWVSASSTSTTSWWPALTWRSTWIISARSLIALVTLGWIIPAKCEFGKSTVEFLGHTVSAAGVAPLTKHIDAKSSFPPTANNCRDFWGW